MPCDSREAEIIFYISSFTYACQVTYTRGDQGKEQSALFNCRLNKGHISESVASCMKFHEGIKRIGDYLIGPKFAGIDQRQPEKFRTQK